MKYTPTVIPTYQKYTKARNIQICSKVLRRKVLNVHNGKHYYNVQLHSKMIGHKLGQYSLTKKIGKDIHNSKKAQKRKNRKKR